MHFSNYTIKKKFLVYFFILFIILIWYFLRERQNPNNSPSEQSIAGQKIFSQDAETKIYFLDVGQGDAVLIKFANNEKMLIDCGANTGVIEALGRVLPFGDRQIDHLLVTHPDLDHYGGCVDVLQRFTVKNFLYSGIRKDTDNFFREFWLQLESEQAQMQIVDREYVWNVADANLQFLFPDKPLPIDLRDVNAGSVILKMSIGK